MARIFFQKSFGVCDRASLWVRKRRGTINSFSFFLPKKEAISNFFAHFIYQLWCQMTFGFFPHKLNLTQEEKDATTKIMHKKC